MALALPSDSEGENELELEYPGRGATYEDWDVFHNQQIRFVQYQFDEKVKALQNCKTSINTGGQTKQGK